MRRPRCWQPLHRSIVNPQDAVAELAHQRRDVVVDEDIPRHRLTAGHPVRDQREQAGISYEALRNATSTSTRPVTALTAGPHPGGLDPPAPFIVKRLAIGAAGANLKYSL
jgi:hypothetical protein